MAISDSTAPIVITPFFQSCSALSNSARDFRGRNSRRYAVDKARATDIRGDAEMLPRFPLIAQ
jgi:hypothetical protein